MQSGTTTLKTRLHFLKVKQNLPDDPALPLLHHFLSRLKRNEKTCSYRDLYGNVYSNIIHNGNWSLWMAPNWKQSKYPSTGYQGMGRQNGGLCTQFTRNNAVI